MPPLPTNLRRDLERAVLAAREAAQKGALNALNVLAVDEDRSFDTMTPEQRSHRSALRARMKVLDPSDTPWKKDSGVSRGFGPLVEEVAYEQWHRMLFARFLAENDLLIHPRHGVAVSLEECAELAASEGEPDEWMLAARFASEMLPGIFRRDDPAAQIRFAADDRTALEAILKALPSELFRADDALGWVYQFWQTKAKEEVNNSERKVGGKDLAPVTQLFTEHYMVRFLLENSLGAWWTARYPDSPLVREWEYLRWRDAAEGDERIPAAGKFEGWPATAREITVMDPCCGSGHFLVAAGEMLRKMRMEEEGLTPSQAAEAVLGDNLFGLELDARCTQLAAFSLVFDAWKTGLEPKTAVIPNIACSGVPVGGQLDEWIALAGNDANLVDTLTRLYALFKNAEDLGSLINPAAVSPRDQLFSSRYEDVAPLLQEALRRSGNDPAAAVFGATAEGVERAGRLLARQYTLVATNPPYRSGGTLSDGLREHIDRVYEDARADLGTVFFRRSADMTAENGGIAIVLPQNWLSLTSYTSLRKRALTSLELEALAWMGVGAFDTIGGEVVKPVLAILAKHNPSAEHRISAIDVRERAGSQAKSQGLVSGDVLLLEQAQQLKHPDHRIIFGVESNLPLLSSFAQGVHGLGTKDSPRFIRCFWEVGLDQGRWEFMQASVDTTLAWGGMEHVVMWDGGKGVLHELAKTGAAILAGAMAHGKPGVLVSQVGNLNATLYHRGLFEKSAAVISPSDPNLTAAIWAFCGSSSFREAVRRIDDKVAVTNTTLVKVPFDAEYWQAVAAELYPNGLPEPHSDDPTQWLFKGEVPCAAAPLQVAVSRLLGHHWPGQRIGGEDARLSAAEDEDGIVCLPALQGEKAASERLRAFLAAAYDEAWSPGMLDGLLKVAGYEGKSLEQWLRDGFFDQHCKLFHHRPFIWHVWDGRRDGFSALVNYHRLDHAKLQKLAYTYLGSWIERQRDEKERGLPGSDDRLAAAIALQKKLADILAGEPPYDIYVRWKKLHEQPIGWNPDPDDGVRLNIRPFMTAGVLRWKPNIKWEKDRGKNPDGSERLNDLHYTVEEKLDARRKAGVKA